jgi:hypothetical protein
MTGASVGALLAIGWRGAADIPMTLSDALWSLAVAFVLTAFVVRLAHISMRQREEERQRQAQDREQEQLTHLSHVVH